MANPIKPKRSYTPSSVPLATDLTTHEMAVNWNDGKIFTKNASGNIVTWSLGSGGGGTAEDTLLRSLFVPGAPTSVTATASNAQATVSWTAPTGVIAQAPVTDYVVQYSSNSGSSWTTFSDGTSTTASATVTGLTNGTAYTFRVAAVNGVGQGAWSTASSAVTPQAGDPLFSKVSLLLHMDGTGSTFVDSSKYGSTVTAYGAATQSSDQSRFGGKSLALDGSSARLTVPGAVLSFPVAFVLEAWVYPTSLGAYAPIMEGRTSASYQNWICGLYNVSGSYKLDFVTDGGGSARLTSASSVPLNQWSHIAFVRSGSTLACYINGTRDANTVSYSGTIAPADSVVTIGKNVDGNFFTGYIDEIRATRGSDRSYTGATITVPTNPFADAAPGGDPWFDEVAILLHLNGSLVDSGPLGNTLSASGFAPSTAQVKFGSGSYLNSSSSGYIYTNTTPALGTGDYTMEGWFYPTGDGSYEYHTMFDTRGVGDSSSGKNFGVRTTTGRLYADGTGDIFGSGGPSVTLNQWNHIAFCRSGGVLRGYVNGVQQGSSVSSTFNHTAGQITVASNSFSPLGAEPFRGYVDDVRVTRAARYKDASFTVPTAAFPNSASLAAYTPIPLMTSATSPSGTVSDSGILSAGTPSWSAFDKAIASGDTTFYASPSPATGNWIQYDFGFASSALGYQITSRQLDPYGSTQAPPSWTLSGSSDGSTFTVIDTRTAQSWAGPGETKSFSLSQAETWRYWRWTWTSSPTGGAVVIPKIKLTDA